MPLILLAQNEMTKEALTLVMTQLLPPTVAINISVVYLFAAIMTGLQVDKGADASLEAGVVSRGDVVPSHDAEGS